MEQGEILENISKSISERLKVPIIVTYISVLILYNWDILFHLLFENDPASIRIQYIKENYSNVYFERIIICLGIAILLIIVFAILNTFINFILKWFYKKDKETTSEIENFEKIDSLTEQLAQAIEEIKILKTKNENLKNINENLNLKSINNIEMRDISQKDYDDLLSYINSRGNKEKLLYSLREFISELKKDRNSDEEDIYKKATYNHEMKILVAILIERKLLEKVNFYHSTKNKHALKYKLSKSFEDILKMDLD
jgi:hypothetical protein